MKHPHRKVGISGFKDKFDNQPKPKEVYLDELMQALSKHRLVQDKESAPLLSPATFRPGTTRSKANVWWVSMLLLDYDDGTSVEEALEPWKDYPFVYYTTFSHTEDHPKFRVVIPLSQPVPGELWETYWKLMHKRCAGAPDKACKDASRMYYVPSAPIGSTTHRAGINEGAGIGYLPVDLDELKRMQSSASVLRRTADVPIVRGGEGSEALLAFDPRVRRKVAEFLEARFCKSGFDEIVRYVPCPRCSRESVWFAINPSEAHHAFARCNHRTTDEKRGCDWEGPLANLVMEYAKGMK